MWSYYWDEITDRITKSVSDVLMPYQLLIEFSYGGSKRSHTEVTIKSLVILRYHQYVYDQLRSIKQPRYEGLLVFW